MKIFLGQTYENDHQHDLISTPYEKDLHDNNGAGNVLITSLAALLQKIYILVYYIILYYILYISFYNSWQCAHNIPRGIIAKEKTHK